MVHITGKTEILQGAKNRLQYNDAVWLAWLHGFVFCSLTEVTTGCDLRGFIDIYAPEVMARINAPLSRA